MTEEELYEQTDSPSMLKDFLTDLAAKVPIVWDRYTNAGTHYYVYGWIERSDGKRDFVVVEMEQNSEDLRCLDFVTSSAKYSREIMKFMFITDAGHKDCIKYEDMP